MPEPKDYKTVGIVSSKTRIANRREQRLAKDMAAYKRLRADGEQPKGIDGSAVLEQTATMSIEVEMGKTFAKKDHQHVREGERISEELGMRGAFDK